MNDRIRENATPIERPFSAKMNFCPIPQTGPPPMVELDQKKEDQDEEAPVY